MIEQIEITGFSTLNSSKPTAPGAGPIPDTGDRQVNKQPQPIRKQFENKYPKRTAPGAGHIQNMDVTKTKVK